MPGLVEQLQADALDRNVRITDLLRTAKVVSVKLDLTEVANWIEHELSGYLGDTEVPEYRRIRGAVKFLNPMQGWMPVIFEDSKTEDFITLFSVRQSLASLEQVAESTESKGGYLRHDLSGAIQSMLCEQLEIQTQFQMQFSVSHGVGIIDAVRNRVLEWSLQLEKAGILGDGLSFNQKEQQAAHATSNAPVYNIQNVGVLGDVANSSTVNQNNFNYSPTDLSRIGELIEQVQKLSDQMEGQLWTEVEAATSDLSKELDEQTPDSGKIRGALNSLRAICEGASGNLIANGILGLIKPFV